MEHFGGLTHKWDMLKDDGGVCRCVRCRVIWSKANRFDNDCPGLGRLVEPPPITQRVSR